ncbi:MAG: hypothetical protein JWP92_2557 [Caulobacter sp.]|nr:hypothetical protein [Caulobacter sp.]
MLVDNALRRKISVRIAQRQRGAGSARAMAERMTLVAERAIAAGAAPGPGQVAQAASAPRRAPRVSVLMANHNGGPFIAHALASVQRQTLQDLEIIVVDDGSRDDSVAVVRRLAMLDPRIRLLLRPEAGGPGAARNAALAAARGQWVAIVDSDDLIHPERLKTLVAKAETDGADIAVDDLLIFSDDGQVPPRALLSAMLAGAPRWIDLPAFIRSNRLFGREPALGFTKPLIRRQRLLDTAGAYDEALPVGEDYDLLARAMARGLSLRAYPDLTYFYRKRSGSISHRLDDARLAAMVANAERFRAQIEVTPAMDAALRARERSIKAARAFTRIVERLKARRFGAALRQAAASPAGASLLRVVAGDWLAALGRRLTPSRACAAGRVVVLSRQRVIGATNGSSTYLLGLCQALKAQGASLEWLGPSPTTFGRWPWMRLTPQMRMFDRVRLRGGWRVGDLLIARNPAVLGAAALTALESLLAKLKLRPRGWVKPAPYAISAEATDADRLYIAARARGARAILVDYAFLAPLAPYALTPDAPCLVVMHDLFSSRDAQFAAAGAADSVTALGAAREFELLSQADAVIAIQEVEGEVVRRANLDQRVIVAPLAITPAAAAQPGVGASLLFVGSNTAPNVIGLQWFFDEVWPIVTAGWPEAVLTVVGNVSRAIDTAPAGVRMLGPVPDLASLYDQAAVVVSPLTAGSGLKIKIIEALGWGKAVVATSVSLQGVEDLLKTCVLRADDPAQFAAHILDLLADPDRRAALGEAALERARASFSPQACYGELVEAMLAGD